MRSALRTAALVVFLALPLLLRAWPIGHGAPDNFLPDTHIVRSALGMARDRTIVPQVGVYSTYPNLLPYMLLPLYAAQFGVGIVAGSWADADGYGERLLEEPRRAHGVARWLVMLLATATPWLVYRGARAAGLRGGAWAAAWLVATGLLHVHFSVQERPWAPMVTFMALSAWPAILYARGGRRRHLLLAAALAGLAFACHQAGLLVLGISGLAWLVAPLDWHGADLRRRLQLGVAAVALFAFVGVLVGHPYLAVHGWTPASQVAGADQLQGDLSIGGQAVVFALSAESFARLAHSFFGYDPVLVLLTLIGLLPALRQRSLLPVTLFGLAWAVFFMTNQNDKVRYLLPLTVLCAYPAGFAVERLWRLPSRSLRALLLALLAFPLLQGLRFDWVMRQTDTRHLAAIELERYRGARLAIDCYGPQLPKNALALQRVATWRDLGAREAHRLAQLEAGAGSAGASAASVDTGFDVVPIEDLFDFDMRSGAGRVEAGREHLGADPQAILAGLEVDFVLLVDRDPADGRPPLLMDAVPPVSGAQQLAALELGLEPEFVIHPAAALDVPCEGRLPTEMVFPLTGLWHVQRPGPRLELFRLLR